MIDFLALMPCFLIVLYGVSFIVGAVVFEPLRKEDDQRHRPWQFRISDLMVLLVQLQVVGVLVVGLLRWLPRLDLMIIVFFAWLVLAGWWLSGVRLVSRAGIEEVRLRLTFLGFILPLGYGLSLILMLAPGILLIHAAAIVDLILSGGRSGTLFFVMMAAIELAVVVAAIACRRLSAWIVRCNQRILVEREAAASGEDC
jgi:hypothetical protein